MGKKLLKARLSWAERKFHILDKFTTVNPRIVGRNFTDAIGVRARVVTMD